MLLTLVVHIGTTITSHRFVVSSGGSILRGGRGRLLLLESCRPVDAIVPFGAAVILSLYFLTLRQPTPQEKMLPFAPLSTHNPRSISVLVEHVKLGLLAASTALETISVLAASSSFSLPFYGAPPLLVSQVVGSLCAFLYRPTADGTSAKTCRLASRALLVLDTPFRPCAKHECLLACSLEGAHPCDSEGAQRLGPKIWQFGVPS